MQLVNYAPLPNRKPDQYIFTLVELHRFINDKTPNYREFRRYLLERDMLQKEQLDEILGFLGVTAAKGKPSRSSKFLEKLYSTTNLEERKKVLFEHLAEKNEILIKYVLDGLNERLYSTNELYRFITSYVYPGDYVTLVNFRAWMNWLEASEHIKMIGIRWGLSALGEEAMSYIKTIDIDMILEMEEDDEFDDEDEDEEDEEEEELEEEPEEAPAPVVTPAPVAAAPAVTAPEPTPAAAVSAPVAAAPAPVVAAPVGAQPVAYAATGAPQVVIPAGTETVQVMVQPVEARVGGAPLKLVQEAFEAADEEALDEMGESSSEAMLSIEQLRIEPELAAENLRAIQSWWDSRPAGRMLRATQYGFTQEAYEADPAYELFRLACLSVSLFRFEGRLQVGRGGGAFGRLDQMGLFTNLFKSRKKVDTILEELFKAGLSNQPELFCNLHYFLLFRRAIKSLGDKGVRALGALEGADEIVGKLWQELGHFSLHYEIFWIAREMCLMGAWENEGIKDLAVVPLPRVRDNAFQLGFIESPYAPDFPSLVGISRRLSALFGERYGFEAALMYFDPRRSELNYDRSEANYFTRVQMGID